MKNRWHIMWKKKQRRLDRGRTSESFHASAAYYDQVDFGASYIDKPKVTRLEHIKDAEVPAGVPELHWVEHMRDQDPRIHAEGYEMVAFKLKNWSATIMIYSEPFKRDGVHSATITKCGGWDDGTVMALCDAYKKYGAKGAILDVGANIGGYTLPLARCLKDAGSRNVVIAVEADWLNRRHLRAGIKYNNFDNVHLYEYAAGPGQAANKVTMHQGNHNHGMPFVTGDADPKNHENPGVPVTTIDAILYSEAFGRGGDVLALTGSKSVFAMKMDIEGYEPQALQGAKKLLQKHPPCIINIEDKTSGEQTRTFLEAAGYVKKVPHPDPYNKFDSWYERSDFDACVASLNNF